MLCQWQILSHARACCEVLLHSPGKDFEETKMTEQNRSKIDLSHYVVWIGRVGEYSSGYKQNCDKMIHKMKFLKIDLNNISVEMNFYPAPEARWQLSFPPKVTRCSYSVGNMSNRRKANNRRICVLMQLMCHNLHCSSIHCPDKHCIRHTVSPC